MIKSFRGKIDNEAIQTIRLSTNDGLTGYKITKFQLFPDNPGTTDVEHVVKIFSVPQTGTPDNAIDYNNPTLLASGYLVDSNSVANSTILNVVFDNVISNQDMFITHKEALDGQPVNWYIEMEQIRLNLNEATVATLKDMRGRE